ncbi:uncharacterized protein [Engystomops pustulosus]|uniref:uncharacterized protein n=1 Tax=Engystomops pustulosus TaxID=76066 RepID=UPI003AFA7B76
MPSCLINQCNSKTGTKGQQPGVILHSFPHDLSRIRRWLVSTGQQFSDIDKLAQRIKDENKTNKFCLCSKHFALDAYIFNASQRTLRPEAVPTIFTTVEEGECLIEESLKKAVKRKRIVETSCQVPTPEANLESAVFEKYREISTQTDFDLLNSTIMYNTEPPTLSEEMSAIAPLIHHSQREPLSPIQQKDTDIDFANCDYTCEMSVNDTSSSFFAQSKIQDDMKDKDFCPLEQTLNESELNLMDSIIGDNQQMPTSQFGSNLIEAEQVTERKLLIFESCLDQLLYKVKCQKYINCASLVEHVTKKFDGSYCLIRAKCSKGHAFNIMETQPKIGQYASGNLLLASAILFSGLNFQKIKEFLTLLGVVNISETTYYRYQSLFLFPAIDISWKKEQSQLFNNLQGKNVCISGDGQCDSPGHSAKYCIYTLMDCVTENIVDFEVNQRTQCSSSVAMEKYGFGVCMERIIDQGYRIKLFASDRHFDVWHYAKSIRKKLTQASKGKFNKQIFPWIEKINLHFWWCLQTCDDNVELLREKWLSLLYHISNVHSWEGNLYTACAHGPLETPDADDKKVLWLNPDTPPYKNIAKVVTNQQLLDDLPNLVHNCHTGALECFHSMALKYRTKRIHFGVDAMEARTKLAVLTHNFNTGREQATVKVQRKNTELIGTERTKLIIPKGKKKWIVRNVYEKLSVDYLEAIMTDVLRLCKGEISHNWQSRAPSLPSNLANLERPNKELIKEMRIARFRKNKLVNSFDFEVDLTDTNLFE